VPALLLAPAGLQSNARDITRDLQRLRNGPPLRHQSRNSSEVARNTFGQLLDPDLNCQLHRRRY